MNASLPACMGGFCNHRDHCDQHLTNRRAHVVERLCERGKEMPRPVQIVFIRPRARLLEAA